MDCESPSPVHPESACSLLSSNKDFTSSLFAFEGSFDPTRPLSELENTIPADLPLSVSLETTSPSSIFAANAHIIPTPPPENYDLSPTSLSHYSPVSSNASDYIKGSSLEESPISSPGDCCSDDLFILPSASKQSLSSSTHGSVSESLKDECISILQLGDDSSGPVQSDDKLVGEENGAIRVIATPESLQKPDQDGSSPAPAKSLELRKESSPSRPSSPKSKHDTVPRNIKLPQRKGGMQLWQFLYALLGSSASNKYGKLIEWTANRNSREFRLLEPEAIAIWWGEHKNKKNMSYDKLSRSLRYYYDKGIIRKIPGERYVYQFCIDPEVMYKHIGNSDCRPKLKPMPANAHRATSDYQLRHGFNHSLLHKEPIFMHPGPLMMPPNGLPGSYPLTNAEMPFPPPEYPALPSYPSSNFFESAFPPPGMDMYNSAPVTPPAGVEFDCELKAQLPMRKCNSYDSYMYQDDTGYGQSLMPTGAFMPGVMGPPPLQAISPPHPPSEGNSPQMSSFPQHPQLLDELIEPAATCELSHPSVVYSPCTEGAYRDIEAPVSWTFN